MFNSQEEFQGMVNAGRITGLILSELKNKTDDADNIIKGIEEKNGQI